MDGPAIDRDARRIAFFGGVFGLLASAALGSLRLFGDSGPLAHEGLFGDVVFALVYMSPYLLTLVASRTGHPAARGGLLLALGMLSLVASFSTFSLVTVILLPSTGAIFLAAVLSLRTPGRRLLLAPPYFAVGLICGAAIGFSFVALFAIDADEPRCWTLARVEKGADEWQSRPNQGGPNRLEIASGKGDIRSTCTSDIITNSEGIRAFAILSIAALVFIGAVRLRWAQRPASPLTT